MEFFATAAKGTEGALRDELRELRLRGVRADRGGVHFAGEMHDGQRACLHSRIAMRVLLVLGRFPCTDARSLYDGARTLAWSDHVSPSHTLAVSATGRTDALVHTQFVAQKTKDAVCDVQRDAFGERSSVSLRDPDVRISVHLAKGSATVYLDLSGEPLHRRGFRTETVEAPLKETLAAAILRLARWDRTVPLHDPMCGSGTFALEAAMWSRDIAPGLARTRFGFERWASFDEGAARTWQRLREHAQDLVKKHGPEIIATDLSEASVAATRANVREARVDVVVGVQDISDTRPLGASGFVVCNPPYGERLDAGPALFREMARVFAFLRGHTVAVLAGAPEIVKALPRGLPEHALFNGAIECRLVTWHVAPRID